MMTTLVAAHGRARIGSLAAVAEDDDGVLVARLAAGDDDAIGELFDRYGSFLLGIAQRVVRSRERAEDVVQEVFTLLWTEPGRFDPARGSLRAFLGVQAQRRGIDVVRRETRREAREDRDATDPTRRPGPREATDDVVVSAVVREAIERLPDDQRIAVELAFWHGRTYREVATILEIPEGTAKSRLRLAQARLAEWLAPLVTEVV